MANPPGGAAMATVPRGGYVGNAMPARLAKDPLKDHTFGSKYHMKPVGWNLETLWVLLDSRSDFCFEKLLIALQVLRAKGIAQKRHFQMKHSRNLLSTLTIFCGRRTTEKMASASVRWSKRVKESGPFWVGVPSKVRYILYPLVNCCITMENHHF